jgi:phospholipid/cholesterol/gamma-HCH transport system ATP-binding protein
MSHETLIRCEGLHKSFDGLKVLAGLDLDVFKGETLVIIGESGCGKSVLLKHLIGLLRPDAGRVLFAGTDITGLAEGKLIGIRTRLGMLFQGSALFDSLNVLENVAFPLREHRRLPEPEVRRIVAEKLAVVGLTGSEEKMPADLSGGMKKRVALARAIALDPEVILYDEPTTGLDPLHADDINDLIIHTQRTVRTTTVIVTHDIVSACRVADRIVMLHGGRIITGGSPEEILNSPVPEMREFIRGRTGDRLYQLASAGGASGRGVSP